MVRSLVELSIQAIAFNFGDIARLLEKQALTMPSTLKAEILQRLIDHDLLVYRLQPSITYNLISPALTEFDVHGSLSLSDNLLRHLANSGCQLRRIRLSRCPRISDVGLADLLVNQDVLESLALRYLLIEGKCLEKCRSTRLLELKLIGCANIPPEPVVACVVANATSLVKLNFKGLRKMSSSAMVKILDFVGSKLLYLNLSECVQVNDAVLFRIALRCGKLETLKVRECMNFFELSLVDVFEKCSNLLKLDLSFCVRDEVSGLIEVLPRSLQVFRYYGITTSLSDSAMVSSFRELHSLHTLALNGLNTLSDELLESLLCVVGHRLSALDLSASFGRFTDHGVESIAQYCTSLRMLGLGLLAKLSGQPLLKIFSKPARAALLEKLHLSGCTGFHDSVLHALSSSCPNLQFLDVSGIQHTSDALLFNLAQTSPRLQQILLKGSRSITETGVCALAAACADLRVVSLSGITSISDRTLFALANHCPLLEEVYLSGCMVVSSAAIQYLKDSCSGRLTCYHIVSSANDPSAVVAKNLDTGEYVRFSGT